MTSGSRLDKPSDCREMLDSFAPPKVFAEIRNMGCDQFFFEFNVGAARQTAFNSELRMQGSMLIWKKGSCLPFGINKMSY